MAARSSLGVTPSNGDTITLADLRDLVAESADLPPDATVRAQAAFRGQDLMNPAGITLRELTVQYERPPGPVRVSSEVTRP